MKDPRNDKDGALEASVALYRTGRIKRRDFIRMAVSAGITAGLAGALANAWSPEALAASTLKTTKPARTFDYIVIGSGSAGSALAGRLAGTTEASVLMLEAGGDDDLAEVHDPKLWAASLGTRATKFFNTVPQRNADGRSHAWPRGNVLGGTSALNAMIFARGHRSDYDSWAYAGNTGWSYEEVLPHFKALETWEGGASTYRGDGGPIYISTPAADKRHEGAQAFMEACAGLGFKETPDFNAERMSGQAWVNFNIKDFKRQSSATAFLRPAMARKDLTVLTDAPAIKLMVEKGRCRGVTYLHDGQPHTVYADREVILSAGAIDSPRLLMLSGIGPAEDLGRVGIEAVADLPVGQGLQDHILGAGVNYEAKGPVPLSHYNHSEVYMWERSDSRLPAPDAIALYVSVPFASTGHQLNYEHGYCILSGVARPHSRGHVMLASADPAVPPIVDPNYLSEAQDWKAYRFATELCREIGAGKAYDAFRKAEVLPGGGELSAAQWRTFLGKSLNTYFHPTSTCRMGVDEEAVVDPELRVYGVQNLRVADASIMPSITTSNTNAPSTMIGWKCAEMLRAAAA
ncbi:MAG: GMC family oxidoreductase N-terminal domain-containing protein [Kiloniellales bacterium]|nr:GMC family oxidoreductase N-terminal domain-containing protein [Kiloniellales bacterium]